MKTRINWVAIFIAVGMSFIGGLTVGKYLQKEKLEAWADYYVSTEHLLDILDLKYHWVDSFDHDGYYESQAEVRFLDRDNISRAEAQYEKCLESNNKYWWMYENN